MYHSLTAAAVPNFGTVKGQTPATAAISAAVGISREVDAGADFCRPTGAAGAQPDPAGRPSWHTSQKGAQQMRAALQGSGTFLQLLNLEPQERPFASGGLRGRVGDVPSAGVQRRYCQAVAAVPWEDLRPEDVWACVLTYHNVPRNGLQVREDKKAFCRRLDRVLGDRGKGTWAALWVKEFQARGSIHYHMVLHTPYGAPAGFPDIVRDAWLGVIGEASDEAAKVHGVMCSQVVDMHKVKAYVSKYMGKSERSSAKAYQKRQPAWFKNGGRWWGIVGRSLCRRYEAFMLHTRAEFVSIKRLIRSYSSAITHGHYVPHSYRAESGMSLLTHGRDYQVLRDLVRWVTMQRQGVCALQTS